MSTRASVKLVLDLIARLRRDVTVTDLVRELAMQKSSASRTLSKMAEHGLLEREPTTRAYRPGAALVAASYHFRTSRTAMSLLDAALDDLVIATGYSCYLNLLDRHEALVIAMRTGGKGLQLNWPIGTRSPAQLESTGRAMLARRTDEEVLEAIGESRDPKTGRRQRPHKNLLARLAAIRAAGWSLSRGEFVSGVAGIAAAVVDVPSRVIYGIGVAIPVQDLSEPLIDRCGQIVRDAACNVGRQIGDPYWLSAKSY